mmetsp:Transcript_9797/g.19249  ORF Transcript_9797/g.19249 Transcript_9797/m.19249 type:complete len:83 (+) Transcript_9797:336-584(+)
MKNSKKERKLKVERKRKRISFFFSFHVLKGRRQTECGDSFPGDLVFDASNTALIWLIDLLRAVPFEPLNLLALSFCLLLKER